MKIAVLRGGLSAERQVSLKSGIAVEKALRSRGHEVTGLDLTDIDTLRRGAFDCVFIALHGRLGEDGALQGFLEVAGLPYTGSGVLASALCMDKTQANRLMSLAGLSVPRWEELTGADEETALRLAADFDMPLVVKPVREGSTIGLSIVRSPTALRDAVSLAMRHDDRILLQQFVDGVEITVGVLATPNVVVLPPLEIVHASPVYDYQAKYTAGGSQHVIPARISAAAMAAAVRDAELAFTTLGCEGLARVDMIVTGDSTWLLEVNTIPGMTDLSLLPDAARAAGIPFPELCESLVLQAIARHRGQDNRCVLVR